MIFTILQEAFFRIGEVIVYMFFIYYNPVVAIALMMFRAIIIDMFNPHGSEY